MTNCSSGGATGCGVAVGTMVQPSSDGEAFNGGPLVVVAPNAKNSSIALMVNTLTIRLIIVPPVRASIPIG